MKILLYSIFISFIFVSLYMTLIVILLKNEIVHILTIEKLLYLLKIPQAIYYFIFPINYMKPQDISQNERIITSFGFFVFNVLIYSVPINLILQKIFQKSEVTTTTISNPPPPPTFE
jgi:hypothetical protein